MIIRSIAMEKIGSLYERNKSLLQIVFSACITGILYESGAFVYREKKYKNIFNFVRKWPGASVSIGTSMCCLGIMS